MRAAAVLNYFKRASAQLGFRIQAHKFRATFATTFLRHRPEEVETLRRLRGHADYSMVTRYVRMNASDLGRGWERRP